MARRPVRPRELIECAEALIGMGAGRPKTTFLRRATSSAYYAVFHQISWHSAQWMVPTVWREAQAPVVARWYSHESLDRASQLLVKVAASPGASQRGNAQLLFASSSLPRDLVTIATAVSSLRQRRNEADYDHRAEVTEAATLADVMRASAALDAAERLWATSDPSYGNYLLLAFAESLVKHR